MRALHVTFGPTTAFDISPAAHDLARDYNPGESFAILAYDVPISELSAAGCSVAQAASARQRRAHRELAPGLGQNAPDWHPETGTPPL
jgi:hypothetical protein